jgi:protoporphyrinogen oxidase
MVSPRDIESGTVARPVVIVGAGPAGLTAAWELLRRGSAPIVLEADTQVGGISRTVERDGWRFDIGGHRFFTKVPRVEAFWDEMLAAEEFPTRHRLSRIYYGGQFFDYPIKPFDALVKLGPIEAVRCVASYVATRLRPPKDQSDFESWVAARFGWRLYRLFFKTYTEKVWGVPATTIRSDWAAQRIKSLSLPGAIFNAARAKFTTTRHTSLIEEFRYPLLGPGMMWERTADRVRASGGEIHLGAEVQALRVLEDDAIEVAYEVDGRIHRVVASSIISSMPLGELVMAFGPDIPESVVDAAKGLSHRDFLTVALVVGADETFPDNWIYVHESTVKLGRVQNFGAWSPDMVRPGTTCLGLEYFVFEGDELWQMSEDELVAFAQSEAESIGIIKPGAVERGFVVRMPRAYPVYDPGYAERIDHIRAYLEDVVPNVYPVGRNGMHHYNNQDHSMLTAMLAVENIHCATHDTCSVNVEAEYHEEAGRYGAAPEGWAKPGTGRAAPETLEERIPLPPSRANARLARASLTVLPLRRVLRFGFRSALNARRRAKEALRVVAPSTLRERAPWRTGARALYRAAFAMSTIGWLRRLQFRLRDQLGRRHTAVVAMDHLLIGGWNGLSASAFANASGYLLDPSTRLADSAQVDLLRRFDELGEHLYDSEVLEQTPYVARVRAAVAISGHHRGARSDAEILQLAREFIDRYRGLPIPHRPGRTSAGTLPRVRRIGRSDYYEIRDGHHRLAIDLVHDTDRVEVIVERPRSTTPVQRLLDRMSWLDGQRRLYQPVDLPEVSTWPVMRRCDDRLEMMTSYLESTGRGESKRYLDVGACYGWFVDQMGRAGYDAHGIESDPLSRELAPLAYGLDPSRLVVGDAVALLGEMAEHTFDVVSCFSVLHHFVLGRAPVGPEVLLSRLDHVTGDVLFIDTGEGHESWFRLVLPEWDVEHIRRYILEHSSFRHVDALGTDRDGVGPFLGKYSRTLFACTR